VAVAVEEVEVEVAAEAGVVVEEEAGVVAADCPFRR
jgi:hypothetical protein